MTTVLNDFKFGVRMLAKNPGFTGIIVLTLALGIGANTAVFSFLDPVLLRTLPVPKARELVKPEYQYHYPPHTHSGGSMEDAFNYPLYVSFRDQSGVFSGLAAYTLLGGRMADLSELRVGDSAESVPMLSVSSNYFAVLGIRPVIGRFFLAEEETEHGVHSVAVISHRVWSRLFDGDPAVLGKAISLNNHSLTVVGVTPPEFSGTVSMMNPGVYIPLGTAARMDDFVLDGRSNHWLYVLGRLKPGVSRAQAEARLLVMAERFSRVEEIEITHVQIADGSRGTNLMAHEGGWWIFLALFQTPTLLILLVACANVANILLARGMMRQREIAIRRAMGANRMDVIRQLLVESAIMALLSGVCGVLLAHWLTIGLRTALPFILQVGIPIGVDGRILALTLLGSLGSVFLFGLAPALQVSRLNVMTVLKDGAGAVTLFSRRFSLRNCLVVFQVAFSVIVLSFGVLCLLSLRALRVADPGYNAKSVLAVSVHLKRNSPANLNFQQLFAQLQERVTSLPGVQAVSLASGVPLSRMGGNKTGAGHIEGFQMPADGSHPQWAFTTVGPGYFQTLGVPLVRGREFSPQDGPGTSRVMIVNEVMARRFWPDQDPIGKHVDVGGGPREVVGVVKSVKLFSIRAKPEPLSFWPLAQELDAQGKPSTPADKRVLLIRTQGDQQALVSLLQGELESAGLTPATYQVGSLSDRAGEMLDLQRAVTGLLGVIGAVGLLFVATGIAGVMAFEVSQRTREIGVRMALGAQWKDVLRLVLRKGALLTGIGLALGLSMSCVPFWILTRLLPGFRFLDEVILYGIHLWDPLTYLCVALLVSLIMLVACWLPARRAAKIDPMEALRYE